MQDQLVDSYEYRIKQLEEANRRLQEENQQVHGTSVTFPDSYPFLFS